MLINTISNENTTYIHININALCYLYNINNINKQAVQQIRNRSGESKIPQR